MSKRITIIIIIILISIIATLSGIVLINSSNKNEYQTLIEDYQTVLNQNIDLGYIHNEKQIKEFRTEFEKAKSEYTGDIETIQKTTDGITSEIINANDIDISKINLKEQYKLIKTMAIVEDIKSIASNKEYSPKSKDEIIEENKQAIDQEYSNIINRLKINDDTLNILIDTDFTKPLSADVINSLKAESYSYDDVKVVDEARINTDAKLKIIKDEDSKLIQSEKEAKAKANDAKKSDKSINTDRNEKDNNTSDSKVDTNANMEPINISVAQFNVLKPSDESYGSWVSRKNNIATTMINSNADVISLNEIYEDYQINDLETLSGYNIIKPTDGSPYGWTSAIAYKSNITLIDYGAYFFKNQEKYTTGNLAGKYASRTAVWGIFEKEDRIFGVISTQFQNDWYTSVNELQENETKELAGTLMETYDLSNVIVAGDFNMDNYQNKLCTGHNGTYVGSGGPLNYDYICSAKGVNNQGYTVNSGSSDHILVYTQITV